MHYDRPRSRRNMLESTPTSNLKCNSTRAVIPFIILPSTNDIILMSAVWIVNSSATLRSSDSCRCSVCKRAVRMDPVSRETWDPMSRVLAVRARMVAYGAAGEP